MNYVYFYIIIIFMLGCKSNFKKEIIKNDGSQKTFEYLKNHIVDPPAEFRIAPLWDWNEDINETEISLQLEEFKSNGFGGVFIHPRHGMITEYLSDEWFRLFDFTVYKAEELGLYVWIYDENSYPSGFAGGHVPESMPESYNRGVGLSCEIVNVLNEVEEKDDIEVVLRRNFDKFTEIPKKDFSQYNEYSEYFIFRRVLPQKSYWYAGKNYVDLLNPEVTEKFIDITLRNGYANLNKKDFGTSIPGIFSDESSPEPVIHGTGAFIRWTPDLWDMFFELNNYDLKLHLPSLLMDIGDWRKIRHDYRKTILKMFVSGWAKPYAKYCSDNNLIWTGHYSDHIWPEPTYSIDVNAIYLYTHMPGIDLLGKNFTKKGQGMQFGNSLIVSELKSLANQTGKNRTLCEIYGGGGFDVNFNTFKRYADWSVALGINFLNPHLSFYSINGVRKYDLAPTFSYHNPWWNSFKILSDYMGRISLAMSLGENRNNILVLQPNTTAWMYFTNNETNHKVELIRSEFKNFLHQLDSVKIEYDLGSEYIIEALGHGKNEGKFGIGERDYSLVLIPSSMENMEVETIDRLENFLKSGGKVFSFINDIERIGGTMSARFKILKSKYREQLFYFSTIAESEELIREYSNSIIFSDQYNSDEVYFQRRRLKGGDLIFIVNSDDEKIAEFSLIAKGEDLLKIDLFSGNIVKSNFTTENFDEISKKIKLYPSESILLYVSESVVPKKYLSRNYFERTIREDTVEVNSNFDFEINFNDPNCLVIDYLDLNTDKSQFKNYHFKFIQDSLYRESGISFGNPWSGKIQFEDEFIKLDDDIDKFPIEAKYYFYINENFFHKIQLDKIEFALERADLWSEIQVNGSEINYIESGYWLDREFSKFSIGDFLQPGSNEIKLKVEKMSVYLEIMPIYLLGDFNIIENEIGARIPENGSRPPFIVSPKNDNNYIGSWSKQGYPFYSGKVSYVKSFQVEKKGPSNNYFVQLSNWHGSVAEVYVNDNIAGFIFSEPYQLNISDYIQVGKNKIEILIIGSLKNVLGPFYVDEAHLAKRDWMTAGDWYKAPRNSPMAIDYNFENNGLLTEFKIFEIIKNN